MDHALWIGGPPASGKTTIARLLARRYGLRLSSADTLTWVHRDRALAAGNEAALRWESLMPSERWVGPTPRELLAMSLHHERGAMVIDDLQVLPHAPLIVAEGSPLPASAVSSGVIPRAHSIWLLPTADFQRARLAAAGTTGGPAALYEHLRAVIEREAREHDVPVLIVDGSASIPELVAAVEERFGAALRNGPRAETVAERQSLLREMNDAIVGQVRGYYARPWASGDPEAVRQMFVCECGDPACDLDVERSVGEVSAHPAYGPGHLPAAGTRMEG